ncbi:MIZ zinc finger protein [Tolypocladium capitatum]|uniref:MIZ zinc finger protein n=1 Tax=Tolypocladium capitatum TaxID=45235 RepID=A0A2K3PX37_9HYPO|nr:MIZ zinc finger protein [Tolypocladium capitatum]
MRRYRFPPIHVPTRDDAEEEAVAEAATTAADALSEASGAREEDPHQPPRRRSRPVPSLTNTLVNVYMPPPTKKPQPRAGAASSISTINETSFAFLGARRPEWMASGARATPSPGNDHDSTPPAALATRRAKQPSKASTGRHALPSASVVSVDAQAAPQGAREPERRSNDTASRLTLHGSAVVLPSPALSSEPSSAISTPVPVESTSCANASAATEQPAAASAVGGGTLPTASQAPVPGSAYGDVEPGGAAPHPVATDTTQRTNRTVQGSHASTALGPFALESFVPTDLPTPPRPRTLDPPATSSAATKRKAPAPEASQRGGVGDEASDDRRRRRRTEDGPHQAVGSPGPLSLKSLLHEWLERIKQRLRPYRDPQSLRRLEKPRYRLLFDACAKADPVYIVLHQVFCRWSFNRESVYALLEPDRHVVDSSFELLMCALRNNSELSRAHLQWFSSFPLRVDCTTGAMLGVQTYSHIFVQINAFLRHFATGWGQLLVMVNSRKYPLMVWELKDILKCTSPVLQEILFISSRRTLKSDDRAPLHELQRVFSLDQRNESRIVDGSERNLMRGTLASRYKVLIREGCVDSSRPEYSSTPATAPSPARGLARSPSDATGTPMASYRSRPAHQPHSPVIPQYQAPRPAPRPTAEAGASSPPVPVQQVATWQPIPPRTTSARQLAAFPSTLVRPGQLASKATPRPLQTWQPMQYIPSQASQYPSPGSWPSNHGIQQQCSPVTTCPSRRDVLQTTPVAQQPLPLWSDNAFRLDPTAASHDYPPPIQPVVRALPEQMRQQPAASLPRSQHEVVPIPESEYPHSEHDWSSLRQSLHLVHLRSPRRVPSELRRTRYYQFVSHFAVEPRTVLAQPGLRILEFSVPPDHLSRIVRTSDSSTLPTALYSGGSIRYRLRLCRSATSRMRASDWPVSPSFWPPHIFLTFNGQAVHPRRRQHFHHDLPIELTDSLRLGQNAVVVSLPATTENVNNAATCFMAVEVVTTLDYAAIRSMIDGSEHCNSDETRREIARRLRPTDSDDVIVENDVLCVSVADPFSSILFTTPVRGVACKHIECFDLKIWLDTRRGKPSHGPGEPSLVDDWKCPICGLDARPVSLRIDDYFAEVRQKLVEGGCGGTKTIHIKADGSWTAVQEPDEVEDERQSVTQASASTRSEQAPIVVLDDD